jgi:uncharacterized membrane protein YeiB
MNCYALALPLPVMAGVFALFARLLGAEAGIGLSLLQIPLSHWWMNQFQYSPAEWRWRPPTYLKPQPRARRASL